MLLRGGYETADPRLDRIPSFDPRSRRYQIRTLLAEPRPRINRIWTPGITLDQGHEGACTGFSAAHRLSSEPSLTSTDNYYARRLYHLAQTMDEWEGEAYEGSSVLGSMKALASLNLISEYRWIGAGSQTPIDDVVETLGYVGPICFGLDWPASFMSFRPSGLLELDMGTIAGGHAICGVGVLLDWSGEGAPQEVVMLQNSWGDGWGVKGGFCYLRLTDLETLLNHQGEGAVPLEIAPVTS